MLDFSNFPYPVIEPGFFMDINRMADLAFPPEYCVWHHTGGREHDSSAAATNRFHMEEKKWAGIGYHGQFRWDGTLELGRPLNKRGVHASAVNSISIGLCFSGNFEIGDIMARPDQFYSGVAAAVLITKTVPGIKHVRHMDVGTTLCNGRLFPWDSFMAEHDKLLKGPTKDIDSDVLHRVQVGAFRRREGAVERRDELRAKKFDTYIVQGEDGLFRVQVGAFRSKENAYVLADRVKKAGYDFYLTTKTGLPVIAAPAVEPKIAAGSKVRVKDGARDFDGVRLASFVYRTVYDVLTINEARKRAVIGLGGNITAAIHTSNLILQK